LRVGGIHREPVSRRLRIVGRHPGLGPAAVQAEAVDRSQPEVAKAGILLSRELGVAEVDPGDLDGQAVGRSPAQRPLRFEQHARTEIELVRPVVEPFRLLSRRQAWLVGRGQVDRPVVDRRPDSRLEVESIAAEIETPREAGRQIVGAAGGVEPGDDVGPRPPDERQLVQGRGARANDDLLAVLGVAK
jgi:hypothetical protein